MSGSFRGGQPDKVLEQTPEMSQPDGVHPRLEGESAHEAVPDTSDSATPTAYSRDS